MVNDALKWAIPALAIAVIAAIVSLFALVRAGTTDQRDRNTWRLAALKDEVAAFLRSSEKRSEQTAIASDISSGTQPESAATELETLKNLAIRISSLTDGDLDKLAKAIVSLHELSYESFKQIAAGNIETKDGRRIQTLSDSNLLRLEKTAKMDQELVKKSHDALISTARKEYGIAPKV